MGKVISFIIQNDIARSLARPVVERILYNRIMSREDMPREVLKEQYYIFRNMIRAADRAIKNRNISPQVRDNLARLFTGTNYFTSDDIREEFKQQYGYPPPSFLTISPTKRCNLNCIGCYATSSSASAETLPYSIVSRVIREQKSEWGSNFTVISGGEPFLYKSEGKNLYDLLDENSTTFFLIYTNGTCISKEVARRLNELGNATPAISVEGLEKETDARRGKGIFKKILAAFENLQNEGVPYGISITATRHNADLVLSDEFIDFFFEKWGVIYAWLFQYMPIGRGYTLDLMVTPEQRLRMFRRTRELINERGIFMADFWNSGTLSGGCISAGRSNCGYIYIDWDGNVTPCVFNPYAVCNIMDIYKEGKTLSDVLNYPLMVAIRKWQKDYIHDRPHHEMGNMIRQCAIRDHYKIMKEFLKKSEIRPINNEAREALLDEDYYKGLVEYGEKLDALTRDIWKKEYLKIN